MSLLASADAAKEHGLPQKMRMVSFAFAGVDPEVMGIGPVPATDKALAKAGLTIDDIGLFEINEAFAVQVLAFLDNYGIAQDSANVNAWGGAIAVGHPPRVQRRPSDEPARAAQSPNGRTSVRHHDDVHRLGQGGTVIWENPNFSKSAARKAA